MTTDIVEQEARIARARIVRMQHACESLPKEQRMDESPPLRHHLSPGVYVREIHLAAGSLVVGKIHRHRHMNIISQGRVIVFTEFGREELKAGDVFESQAGTKRVVLTLEDAIWATIHPNPHNETDIATLEAMYVADDYAELGMVVADLDAITEG